LGGRRAVAGSRRDGGGSPEAASTTPTICDPVRCVWNDRVRCHHSGTRSRTGWPAHASPSRHVQWLCALEAQNGLRVQSMVGRGECHRAFCIHKPRLTYNITSVDAISHTKTGLFILGAAGQSSEGNTSCIFGVEESPTAAPATQNSGIWQVWQGSYDASEIRVFGLPFCSCLLCAVIPFECKDISTCLDGFENPPTFAQCKDARCIPGQHFSFVPCR